MQLAQPTAQESASAQSQPATFSRAVPLTFASVVLVALFARLLTFDGYLPFLGERLEGNMFLLVQYARGFDETSLYGYSVTVTGEWLAGYPPLFVWIGMVQQWALETFSNRPWLLVTDHVYVLRIVSLVAGCVTAGFVAWIGYELAGLFAGWLAGIAWALSPLVLQHNSLALPDPYVYLFTTASLAFALRSLKAPTFYTTTSSLIAAVLAIYAKYTVAPVVLPYMLVMLWLLVRDLRRVWPWAIVHAGLALASAGWLAFGHGALYLSNAEANGFRESGLSRAFDFANNLNNAYFALLPLGVWVFGLTISGAILAYLLNQRAGKRTVSGVGVGLVVLYTVLSLLMVTAVTNNIQLVALRHTLPVTVALMALWAAAVVQIIWAVDDSRYIYAAVILVSLLFFGYGATQQVLAFRRPHTAVLLWDYADANLPPDGAVMSPRDNLLETIWNRPYSGYDGSTTFEWVWDSEPQNNSPATFAEGGVAYYLGSEETMRRGSVQPFLGALTLVKRVPEPGVAAAGPALSLFRMQPPQVQADVTFGEQLTLAGYDLSHADPLAGDVVVLRPYWRIQRVPEDNYLMFVHLLPENSTDIVVQADGPPTIPQRPTMLWTDVDELYIGRDVTLAIPEDTPAGRYHLAVGLYSQNTGARLPRPDGTDNFKIQIVVKEI